MKNMLVCLMMACVLSACHTAYRFRTLARPGHPGESPFGAVLALGYYQDQYLELLAVNDSAVWVCSMDTTLQIPRTRISEMTVHVLRANENPRVVNLHAGMNALPTIAHGYYLLFSAPANVALGRVVGHHATHGTYRLQYPGQVEWGELHRYARFPQGLPANFSPAQIRMPDKDLNYDLPFKSKK